MADTERQPKVVIVTPAGTAAYAYFHRADTKGKFANNKFKGDIVLDGDTDLSGLEEKCRQHILNVFPKASEKDDPFQFAWKEGNLGKKGDDRKEEFEGKIILKASTKHKPKVVDTKRNPLPKGVEARSGDKVRLVASLYAYEQTEEQVEKVNGQKVKTTTTIWGCSLQLMTVQLIEKRTGGDGGLDELDDIEGFDAERDAVDFGGSDESDAGSDDGADSKDF